MAPYYPQDKAHSLKKKKLYKALRGFTPACQPSPIFHSCLISHSLFPEGAMLFLSSGSLGCAALPGIIKISFTCLTPSCRLSSLQVSCPSGRLPCCPRLDKLGYPTAPKIPGVSLHYSPWHAVLSFSVCVSTICLDYNSSRPGTAAHWAPSARRDCLRHFTCMNS